MPTTADASKRNGLYFLVWLGYSLGVIGVTILLVTAGAWIVVRVPSKVLFHIPEMEVTFPGFFFAIGILLFVIWLMISGRNHFMNWAWTRLKKEAR